MTRSLPVLRGEVPPVTNGASRRVLLACMPFQCLFLTPLSTALLGTVLKQNGLEVEERYFHMEFSRIYGHALYGKVVYQSGWFAEILFGEQLYGGALPPDVEEKLTALFGERAARDEKFARFAAYCRSTLRQIKAPEIVGLTTTFYQFLPSLWLAREARALWPHVKVAFGGAACTSPMGEVMQRAYPEIDYVIGGRGERLLVELARAEAWPTPGYRNGHLGAPIDSLPLVDYDAYLSQLNPYLPARHRIPWLANAACPPVLDEGGEESSFWKGYQLQVSYESSKGCWWGEKHHCTFCGLKSMTFSAKASARILEEIDYLWGRYGKNLFATDDILPHEYLKSVVPVLAERPEPKPSFFYEIKANLSRDEVRLLGRAKVLVMQPGIESLSSRLLQLIDKGVKAIQNIALLKWCGESKIKVNWNLLCGIPGETAEDYRAMRALIPHLVHFEPPEGLRKILLYRYAPLFEKREAYGWTHVKAHRIFRLAHPRLDDETAFSMAWEFEAEGAFLPFDEYYAITEKAVQQWIVRHRRGDGLFWHRDEGLYRRTNGELEQYEPTPQLVRIIDATHAIIGRDKLCALCDTDDEIIDSLVDEGILFAEGNKVINLTLDVTPNPEAPRPPPPKGRSRAKRNPAAPRSPSGLG